MAKVELYEVGPRDGFQNLKDIVPTETKLDLIDRMVGTGIRHLQCTSFVSPKAIPQMADAKELAAACVEKYPDLDLFALIPNLYGAKAALAAGIKSVDMVISLSESHNKANINRTHEQSFAELQNVLDNCPELKLTVDTHMGSVMDYFEIFLNRMILCRKAAEKLGLQFKLMINEQQLI